MKIINLYAYEIYDSRGTPTVACDIVLEDGRRVTSSVPSGASVGKFEALELRDGGSRLAGKGVQKAIAHITDHISPAFIGREVDAIAMDQELVAMSDLAQKVRPAPFDTTQDMLRQAQGARPYPENLGANATLAVSMALFRAHAAAMEMELCDFIARVLDYEDVVMPVPMFNVLNGGRHAQNNLSVQEYMLVPYGARSFAQAVEIAVEIFYVLKANLQQAGKSICTGDEGGFAPVFANSWEPLDFLMHAITQAGYDSSTVGISLDVAASEFFDEKTGLYRFDGQSVTSQQLISWYETIAQQYPLISIEDPLAQDDWDSWLACSKALADNVKIVGDDLLVTQVDRIARAIESGAANAVLIKPNQVGTVSQAMQAIYLAQQYNWSVIASHRSGETADSFIADFALGTRVNYVKFGGCSHGERWAKYNRLLQLEFIKLND